MVDDDSKKSEDERADENKFKRALSDAILQAKEDEEKPFWDHFDELRARIIKCVYVLLAFSCLAYLVREPIMGFLKEPLFEVLPEDKQNLVFTGLFESFLNSLRVSAIAGFFFGLPYIFYQFWAFVAPGMHQRERKLAIPFVVAGTGFFVLGAAFAYYIVFPSAFKFMIEYGQPQDLPMITVKEYFSLIFRLFLLFGLSFEFPVALVFMAVIGVIDAALLRAHRRTAIISISIVCALCAPPDVLSMIVMMIPLYLFYEGAIIFIDLITSGKKKEASQDD